MKYLTLYPTRPDLDCWPLRQLRRVVVLRRNIINGRLLVCRMLSLRFVSRYRSQRPAASYLHGASTLEDAMEVRLYVLLILVGRQTLDERQERRQDELHRVDVVQLVDHHRQN